MNSDLTLGAGRNYDSGNSSVIAQNPAILNDGDEMVGSLMVGHIVSARVRIFR
jgi:hypothetical protein